VFFKNTEKGKKKTKKNWGGALEGVTLPTNPGAINKEKGNPRKIDGKVEDNEKRGCIYGGTNTTRRGGMHIQGVCLNE